jgi:hypothetical protein
MRRTLTTTHAPCLTMRADIGNGVIAVMCDVTGWHYGNRTTVEDAFDLKATVTRDALLCGCDTRVLPVFDAPNDERVLPVFEPVTRVLPSFDRPTLTTRVWLRVRLAIDAVRAATRTTR